MLKKYKHVFLSYCHDNRDEVAQLRSDLIAAGESVWWDEDIKGGQIWKTMIRKAMRESYAVIVCLSKETEKRLESGIYPELSDAIDAFRNFGPEGSFLIPVRLSESEIPLIEIDATRTLDSLQAIDLFPADKRSTRIARLVESIRNSTRHP
jgi:hypothetical protein